MRNHIDEMRTFEIRTDSDNIVSPEREVINDNTDTVGALFALPKPKCDERCIRIKIQYTLIDGRREIPGLTCAVDTVVQALMFLDGDSVKDGICWWYEDTTSSLVSQMKKRQPLAIKTRRHLFSTAGNMAR